MPTRPCPSCGRPTRWVWPAMHYNEVGCLVDVTLHCLDCRPRHTYDPVAYRNEAAAIARGVASAERALAAKVDHPYVAYRDKNREFA